MRWDEAAGTLFGVGRVPLGPGTLASAIVALLYWLIGGPWAAWLLCAAASCVVGVVAAQEMERRYGRDPSVFVLDEAVGMIVALLGVPPHLWACILGFVLFRILDIAKPPPIRALERLPGGLGVMADDVAAGLGAWAVVRLVLLAA
jgi:phosphatidylglycerophosphatase A